MHVKQFVRGMGDGGRNEYELRWSEQEYDSKKVQKREREREIP